MSERVHKGTYYKLTNEDKDQIAKYFNDKNLEELLEFCSAIAQAASYTTWFNAELYLRDVGEKKFFRDCKNCGHTFDCDSEFAINECGNEGGYEKWIPFAENQVDRLKELKKEN